MIFRKKPKHKSYDKDNMKPVVKCSILTEKRLQVFRISIPECLKRIC